MSDNAVKELYERLRRVGKAIARINGNNTHSGNLSMRDPQHADIFYITSSGLYYAYFTFPGRTECAWEVLA